MNRSQYAKYIRSRAWKRRRAELVGARSRRCDRCGAWRTPRGLQVHHLPSGYRHLGHEQPGDYLVVCGQCHRQLTRGADPLEPPVDEETLAEAIAQGDEG